MVKTLGVYMLSLPPPPPPLLCVPSVATQKSVRETAATNTHADEPEPQPCSVAVQVQSSPAPLSAQSCEAGRW